MLTFLVLEKGFVAFLALTYITFPGPRKLASLKSLNRTPTLYFLALHSSSNHTCIFLQHLEQRTFLHIPVNFAPSIIATFRLQFSVLVEEPEKSAATLADHYMFVLKTL